MKTLTNIKTAKKAWEILRKANLHHFLDAGALTAIGALHELKINLSDIITDLLENDVLVEFLQVITDSPKYIGPEGNTSAWDDVEMSIIGEIVADFFTGFTGVFKVLRSS